MEDNLKDTATTHVPKTYIKIQDPDLLETVCPAIPLPKLGVTLLSRDSDL